MKYMLLIYENPGTREAFFSDEKLRAEMNAYVDELRESGEYVDGQGLADPSTARVVRVENGVPPSPTVRSWRPRSTSAAT